MRLSPSLPSRFCTTSTDARPRARPASRPPAAWKATQYLGSLIGSPSLRLKASAELDEIYSSSPSSSPHAVSDLLLTAERVPLLVKRFRMTDEESKELERAVGQSEARLRQAREEAHPELVKSEPERAAKKD